MQRKPLVLVGGTIKELGVGDSLAGVFARRSVVYVPSSRVWTAHADGVAVFRCVGAAGSGAAGVWVGAQGLTGGSAGTVGLRRVRVTKGMTFAITIAAGGAAVQPGRSDINKGGNPGGTLTITGPGVNITIPGAPGGIAAAAGAQTPESADPTGLDEFIKSARNVAFEQQATGGASAALLVGGASWPSVGFADARVAAGGAGVASSNSGGNAGAHAPVVLPHVDYSVLLLPLDGSNGGAGAGGAGADGNSPYTGGYGGFGGGGGAAKGYNTYHMRGGMGGVGGGGGAAVSTYQSFSSTSGAGGAGFVTIELLEVNP